MKKLLIFVASLFLLFTISGCYLYKEELINCSIELSNSKITWTIIDFDKLLELKGYNLDEICPIENTYAGYQEDFRDLQIAKDMCFKREALFLNNIELCKKAETCFIKNYCIVEMNIKNNKYYCNNVKNIEEDYCNIINLRENHGYTPQFSADCSDINNINLKAFCEIAYSRKE